MRSLERRFDGFERRIVNTLTKEGVIEPRRRVGIGERRSLAAQRSDVRNLVLLHEGDELVVDLFVANAVGDDVKTRADESLGVRKFVEVRESQQVALVGLFDDGRVDGRRQLLERLVMVVHPHLDNISALVSKPVDPGSCLGGGCNLLSHAFHAGSVRGIATDRREALKRGKDTGAIHLAASLLVTNLQDQIIVGAHAGGGRHAVHGVGLELGLGVFTGVVLHVLAESLDHADMSVKIDDARHDCLAGNVNDLSAVGCFHL